MVPARPGVFQSVWPPPIDEARPPIAIITPRASPAGKTGPGEGTMKPAQKIVAIGAASGVVTMLLALYLLSPVMLAPPAQAALAERLAFALRDRWRSPCSR